MDTIEALSEELTGGLKARARRLQRAGQAGEADALSRLRAIPELAKLDDEALRQRVQRRHALLAVSRGLGFKNWTHALAVLQSASQVDDFGTLLYPNRCCPHFNIWSAHYDEATGIRQEHGGYLLAYRTQFLVVDDGYIRTLGLSPADPDWERMGRDWVRPTDPVARARLYAKLLS